ncbi:MAG TPA: serine/threonine-protein kinase [Candidatus Eisenbacteria bacterium]|nr:serine/threonine-protein kinase [Candidatus Eisenbacteria bacterium]
MTERWAQVGELFEAALRQPREQRAAFVKESCAGDRELETEVRSLLASHDAAGGFLEPEGGGISLPFPEGPAPGQSIGSWRVVRPLATGGMGVVYLVEREDGQFHQRGALKLIRHGLATQEMVQRFLRERQILATLDHPNMARLLDGGTTPEGLPWLVMEYVEGVPLYEWCSEKAPTLRERLRLFLALCGSVEAAHRRLVLHRDIKPANVLVTAEGTPRLLDFGVAKIFSAEGAPVSELTTARAPLTPEYASPEQLRGGDITTASDVYSLGVLLFELATGARPYPTRAEGATQLLRTVLEKDPLRPSTAAATRLGTAAERTRSLPSPPTGGPGALSRALAGDLDNIILKSLAKEPERRYGSVEELGADLRRYLDGRPVEARPSTWRYRTSKFVRRNRVAVGMATVAALAIVAGAAFSLWSAREARRERAVAERRLRDVATMANTVLWDVNEGLASMPGTTPLREKIVDSATKYLNGIAAEGVQDTALIRTLADGFDKLGTVQGYVWSANVGRSEEGYRSLKKAYELRDRLVRVNPAQEEYKLDLASSATKLCNFDREHGRAVEATAMSRRALELMTELRTMRPDVRRYRINIPRLLHNDGLTLIEAGKIDEGVAQIRRGVDSFAALVVWEPKEPSHRRTLAQASTGLAEALVLQPGGSDSALAVLGRARTLLDDLIRENPDDADLLRRRAAVHYNTGRIYLLNGNDPVSALGEAEACAAATRSAAQKDPGNDDAVVSDLVARTFLGHVHAAAGHAALAEDLLGGVIPDLVRRAMTDTTDTRFAQELIEAKLAMGLVELDRAKKGAGAASAAHRQAARQWLVGAREARDRLAEQTGPWSFSREETAAIETSLAACEQGPVTP